LRDLVDIDPAATEKAPVVTAFAISRPRYWREVPNRDNTARTDDCHMYL
jgi:hypothetical protein